MKWFSDFYAGAKQKMAQLNNSTSMHGIMGTCALIAAADGSVSAEEKTKVAALIAKNDLLKVFEAATLRDTFLGYCTKAADEFERLDVLNVVRKLKARVYEMLPNCGKGNEITEGVAR